jgi:hypothetical protein
MREQPFLNLSPWIAIKDGDDDARAVFDRHYSRLSRADGRLSKLMIGPGGKMLLTSPCGRAIFAWRKFRNDDGQTGVNCAIFRNEGAGRSSNLILAAERLAHQRWPGARLYTYVNPRAVRSPNPGYCFKCAGWRVVGITKKRRYLILAKEDLWDATFPPRETW